MKTLISSLVIAAAVATGAMIAPAMAQDGKVTTLVDGKGQSVDSLLLRYKFDATWVIDNNRILIRDTYRDHYLVTMKGECKALELDQNFKFFPALEGRVRQALHYEVHNPVGPICDIAKIEKVADQTASLLRSELAHKG